MGELNSEGLILVEHEYEAKAIVLLCLVWFVLLFPVLTLEPAYCGDPVVPVHGLGPLQ